MFVDGLELSGLGTTVVTGEPPLGGGPSDTREQRAGGLYRPVMPSPCDSRALQGVKEGKGKENGVYELLRTSHGSGRRRVIRRRRCVAVAGRYGRIGNEKRGRLVCRLATYI